MYQFNFDFNTFLKTYWHKKPVIIKQGFKDFIDPIEPDEVAGLAMEEEIDSRFVTCLNGDWKAERLLGLFGLGILGELQRYFRSIARDSRGKAHYLKFNFPKRWSFRADSNGDLPRLTLFDHSLVKSKIKEGISNLEVDKVRRNPDRCVS